MLYDASKCIQVKIEAIFTDYDGTLSSAQVPREEAYVTPSLLRVLQKLSSKIPMAVITTKDLGFVKERVPFAHAIAAVCGLELQIGGKLVLDQRVKGKIELVNSAYYDVVKNIAVMDDKIIVERKTIGKSDLVAFCVDWRISHNWGESKRIVKPVLTKCKNLGLYIVESNLHPFADVYAIKIDKGTAFLKVKRGLGLDGPIMYLGDSEADNAAFKQADVSIGIKYGRPASNLQCQYHVNFDELDGFLSSLLDSNLDFVPSMAQG